MVVFKAESTQFRLAYAEGGLAKTEGQFLKLNSELSIERLTKPEQQLLKLNHVKFSYERQRGSFKS